MTPTLESILMAGALDVLSFPPNSRYHTVATLTLELPDGGSIVYLARRFVPAVETLTPIREYRVEGGDRLDKLANEFYADPELFWRICDANGVMQPQELTETPGRVITIALPVTLPGGGSG